jgi:hypothetical protein
MREDFIFTTPPIKFIHICESFLHKFLDLFGNLISPEVFCAITNCLIIVAKKIAYLCI